MKIVVLFVCVMASVAVAQTQKFPVLELHVEGAVRTPKERVLEAAGVAIGQAITPAEMEAACKRLADTGQFTAVRYSYKPARKGQSSGYAVTFTVEEATSFVPVRLDIPGLDEQELWGRLKAVDATLQPEAPTTETGLQPYLAAVRKVLADLKQPQEVRADLETDEGRMTTFLRPAKLPSIAFVQFEGNQAIASEPLRKVLEPRAQGTEYSDYRFRRLVELNLRPYYEERGHLAVRFPAVKAEPRAGGDNAVTARVQIDEGRAYQLGQVRVEEEGVASERLLNAGRFRTGKLANWNQVLESITALERELKKDGYLRVRSTPKRQLNQLQGIADLVVEVQRGQKFVFGALELHGLAPDAEKRLRGMWKLAAGAPMNEIYVEDYLKDALQLLGPKAGASHALRPQEGSNVVDVVVVFR